MHDDPPAVAFTPADERDEERAAPPLAELGAFCEIITDVPEDWGAPSIGYFGEPGACGDGQFWRTPGGSIFVRMLDGRTFHVNSVAELAAFLARRNTLPGTPTNGGPAGEAAGFIKRTAKLAEATHAA